MSFSSNNSYTLLEEALYDSLVAIFNRMGWTEEIPVIFSMEGGLEPKNTYCVVNILSRQKAGMTQNSTFLVRETDEMWFTQHYQLYLQLSFLGKRANDLAWTFDESLPDNRVYLEEFQRRNLGWLTKSELRRQPQPRDTKWVPAHNLDINLSFAIQYRQVMDWVEFITFGGEIIRIYPEEFKVRTVEEAIERTIDTGAVREVYSP